MVAKPQTECLQFAHHDLASMVQKIKALRQLNLQASAIRHPSDRA